MCLIIWTGISIKIKCSIMIAVSFLFILWFFLSFSGYRNRNYDFVVLLGVIFLECNVCLPVVDRYVFLFVIPGRIDDSIYQFIICYSGGQLHRIYLTHPYLLLSSVYSG